MTAATRSLRFIRHWRRSVRSPHRPDRKHFLFLPVGAGVPTARTWACINFPTIRKAGCPQPAACQPRNPSGRAHGPCSTKRPVGRDLCVPPPVILCISCNVSLRASDRRHWCGNPYPCITPPAAPFLSAAKEREKRTPPKPMVLESFSRTGYSKIRNYPTTRT